METSSPSKTTVSEWYNKFIRGRSGPAEAERSERPIEESTSENIHESIHDILIDDHSNKQSRVDECELA